MECDLKANTVDDLLDNLARDKDIVQRQFLAITEQNIACPENYDSELLSPADRPSIQALVEEGRRPPRYRKIFNDRTGLDYYPFHR